MGLFSNLFSSKPKVPPADISVLHADMHSHLIPGIDDGSANIEESLALITRLHEFGFKKLVTTPHIMADFYQNTPEIILKGLDDVREAVHKEGIDIEIEAAAEYYLDFDFENKLKEGNLLTFGDNYVLFEVSYLNPPDNLDTMIFEMLTADYKPVLAHPERYPFWHDNIEKYERIKEQGALLQLNVTSLSGHYGGGAKKVATELINKNLVDFLGTDTHHTGHLNLLDKTLTEASLHKVLNSGKLLNDKI